MSGTAEYLPDGFQQPVRLDRLAQVIDRPQLHGFHRVLHLPVVGHDKERGGVEPLVHPFQQGGAVPVRQAEVCQDKVELPCGKGLAGSRQRRGMFGRHPFLLQPVADAAAENHVIFQNQYRFHSFPSFCISSA